MAIIWSCQLVKKKKERSNNICSALFLATGGVENAADYFNIETDLSVFF